MNNRMSFGKYGPSKKHPEGVKIHFVPSGYLEWLIDQDWFLYNDKYEDLLLAIEDELRLRDQNNDHFYEDKIIN